MLERSLTIHKPYIVFAVGDEQIRLFVQTHLSLPAILQQRKTWSPKKGFGL